MDAKEALKLPIATGQMISTAYLGDLTDEELMHRPCEGGNHINWQLGHLLVAEHGMIEQAVPGSMPPLPEGFAEKYAKETSTSDDASAFLTKAELMEIFEKQRAGTMAALESIDPADLDRETGVEYAPKVANLFEMQGTHWVMHAGQWAVIRRQLGRPPLF